MSEHTEQVALFNWARYQEAAIPELKMLYAIPNGGHRHKAVAGKMKAEGVKAGVFDLSFDVARGRYHGMKIEMKWGRGKLTENQKIWMARYIEQGYLPIVCWSWADARDMIFNYLALQDGQAWEGKMICKP